MVEELSFNEQLSLFLRKLCPECGATSVKFGKTEWPYCVDCHKLMKEEAKLG